MCMVFEKILSIIMHSHGLFWHVKACILLYVCLFEVCRLLFNNLHLWPMADKALLQEASD